MVGRHNAFAVGSLVALLLVSVETASDAAGQPTARSNAWPLHPGDLQARRFGTRSPPPAAAGWVSVGMLAFALLLTLLTTTIFKKFQRRRAATRGARSPAGGVSTYLTPAQRLCVILTDSLKFTDNTLGTGSFGAVVEAYLDGTCVAVKVPLVLHEVSSSGNLSEEFTEAEPFDERQDTKPSLLRSVSRKLTKSLSAPLPLGPDLRRCSHSPRGLASLPTSRSLLFSHGSRLLPCAGLAFPREGRRRKRHASAPRPIVSGRRSCSSAPWDIPASCMCTARCLPPRDPCSSWSACPPPSEKSSMTPARTSRPKQRTR